MTFEGKICQVMTRLHIWSLKYQDLAQNPNILRVLDFNIEIHKCLYLWSWPLSLYQMSADNEGCDTFVRFCPLTCQIPLSLDTTNWEKHNYTTVILGMIFREMLLLMLNPSELLRRRLRKQACLPWIHSSCAYLSSEVQLCIKATLFL